MLHLRCLDAPPGWCWDASPMVRDDYIALAVRYICRVTRLNTAAWYVSVCIPDFDCFPKVNPDQWWKEIHWLYRFCIQQRIAFTNTWSAPRNSRHVVMAFSIVFLVEARARTDSAYSPQIVFKFEPTTVCCFNVLYDWKLCCRPQTKGFSAISGIAFQIRLQHLTDHHRSIVHPGTGNAAKPRCSKCRRLGWTSPRAGYASNLTLALHGRAVAAILPKLVHRLGTLIFRGRPW